MIEKKNRPLTYASKDITLLDILDGVLDKGVIIQGNLIISIANIDLVYIDLYLIATSVETAISNNMIKHKPTMNVSEGRTLPNDISSS